LPFFGKVLIISDEETVKTSANIYNYMRNIKEVEDDSFKPLHTRMLIENILNKVCLVYDAESSNATAIEYDAETVQLPLEQFTRYPFRMQRYGKLDLLMWRYNI
jgi:ABC-type dipeptide/oligopeptide/nickel transport system ATPase subunit